jgi:hypothetical protein
MTRRSHKELPDVHHALIYGCGVAQRWTNEIETIDDDDVTCHADSKREVSPVVDALSLKPTNEKAIDSLTGVNISCSCFSKKVAIA